MAEYQFQVFTGDAINGNEWYPLIKDQRGFCLGYFYCHRDAPGPRLAARVVDSKGKVIVEMPAQTEVGIGMVAGWPTAAQYEAAANRALELAKQIRAREEVDRG